MALITCSECGQQISDKAEKCPHCGCPTSAIDNNQETTNYETDEPPATSVTQEDIPTQDNNDAPPPSLNTIKKYKNILLYGSLALLAIFFISHGFGISFWWYLVIAVVILCIMGALGLDGKDLKGDLSAAKTMVTTDIICFVLLFSCAGHGTSSPSYYDGTWSSENNKISVTFDSEDMKAHVTINLGGSNIEYNTDWDVTTGPHGEDGVLYGKAYPGSYSFIAEDGHLYSFDKASWSFSDDNIYLKKE